MEQHPAGFVGYDQRGHFVHNCHCGKWGSFGYGYVGKAKLGKWYCGEHDPTMIANTAHDEARFRQAVGASMQAVRAFEGFLIRKGLETKVNEVKVAPSFEERHGYGDSEDLQARRTGKEWLRFEIKWLRVPFTSKADWPFRTIFIDRATKSSPRADWYISVSNDLSHAALVDGATHETWRIADVLDTQKGYTYQVYVCPIVLARFVRIA